MANRRNGSTNVLAFEIVDDEGNVIGAFNLDPSIYVSKPNRETGKGGGKRYVVAEVTLDLGEAGKFGGNVTLWPPRASVERARETAGTITFRSSK